jgi:acetolactate synthase small subunit
MKDLIKEKMEIAKQANDITQRINVLVVEKEGMERRFDSGYRIKVHIDAGPATTSTDVSGEFKNELEEVILKHLELEIEKESKKLDDLIKILK